MAGVVAGVLLVTMAIHASPLQPTIPTLQFTFSPTSFEAILAQWGAVGVSRYRWHFAIDFPFLASYGVFGYLLVRHASQREAVGLGRTLLAWALPVAAVLDATENVLHIRLVGAAGLMPAWLYMVSGGIAATKWLTICAFALGFLVMWLRPAD